MRFMATKKKNKLLLKRSRKKRRVRSRLKRVVAAALQKRKNPLKPLHPLAKSLSRVTKRISKWMNLRSHSLSLIKRINP